MFEKVKTKLSFLIANVMFYLSFWKRITKATTKAFVGDNRGQSAIGMGIITTVIGFIVVFYIIAYTFTPLSDSANTLATTMNASTIPGVAGLSSLPGVAVLLFILLVILGLIIKVVQSE